MSWSKFNTGYSDLKPNFKNKLALSWSFILIPFKIHLIYLGAVFAVSIDVSFSRVTPWLPIKSLNLNKRYSAVFYFIKSLFQFISVAYPITKYGFKRCLTHLGKELVEEDCPTQDASLRTLTYKTHTHSTAVLLVWQFYLLHVNAYFITFKSDIHLF